MWDDFVSWRQDRLRAAWRRRIAKLPDAALGDEIEDFEERLRMLARGHRGLQAARDNLCAVELGSTGMYTSAVDRRVHVAEQRWWKALREAQSRYDDLQRTQYQRLKARGAVIEDYSVWHRSQPSSRDFLRPD